MTYRLALSLPFLPPMNRAATGRHRMVQHREAKAVKLATKLELAKHALPAAPLARAALLVTRHSASMADRLNIAQAAKPVVDAIVQAGVLADDSPAVLASERYEWQRAPRGQGRLEVIVEEVG